MVGAPADDADLAANDDQAATGIILAAIKFVK
jgi:hypothetical protein